MLLAEKIIPTGIMGCYTPSRPLSHSLFTRLIPSGAFKGGCAMELYGISIAVAAAPLIPRCSLR